MRRTGALGEIAGLRRGDHVCWTYSDDDQHRGVLTTYFSEGIAAGEKLVYLAPRRAGSRLLDYLRADGHDVDALLGSGRLGARSLEDGQPLGADPQARLGEYRSLVEQTTAEGYSGLRMAVEAAWGLTDPSALDWAAHELRADLLAARLPFTLLCAYDLRECEGEAIRLIESVHALHFSSEGERWGLPFTLYAVDDGAIGIHGEVDASCSEVVRSILVTVAQDVGRPVLDLSSLRFADIAGMRAIAEAARVMAAGRDRVVLRGASPTFKRVWTLTGFGEVLSADLN